MSMKKLFVVMVTCIVFWSIFNMFPYGNCEELIDRPVHKVIHIDKILENYRVTLDIKADELDSGVIITSPVIGVLYYRLNIFDTDSTLDNLRLWRDTQGVAVLDKIEEIYRVSFILKPGQTEAQLKIVYPVAGVLYYRVNIWG